MFFGVLVLMVGGLYVCGFDLNVFGIWVSGFAFVVVFLVFWFFGVFLVVF